MVVMVELAELSFIFYTKAHAVYGTFLATLTLIVFCLQYKIFRKMLLSLFKTCLEVVLILRRQVTLIGEGDLIVLENLKIPWVSR